MRKAPTLLVAGMATLCMTAWTLDARACDKDRASAAKTSVGACASKVETASAVKTSVGACASKVETASGSACTVKGSMAHLFKEAPGTKATFQKIDNGIVMTVLAGAPEHVSVVQKAVMSELEHMSTFAGSKCAVSAAKAGESCSFTKTASIEKAGSTCTSKAGVEKASVEKAGASCTSSSKASVETASATMKAGSGCCASKAGAKASIEQASASVSAADCPEWMKVLCGANCVVEKTANGVKVTWTTDKSDQLTPLQAAGEQFEAEVTRL